MIDVSATGPSLKDLLDERFVDPQRVKTFQKARQPERRNLRKLELKIVAAPDMPLRPYAGL